MAEQSRSSTLGSVPLPRSVCPLGQGMAAKRWAPGLQTNYLERRANEDSIE